MYLLNIRPDICFAVNTLIHFLMDPRHVHLIAENHVLRYLKAIMDYRFKYDVNQNIILHGYVDSNWVGSTTDKKSTSGCCFILGSSMISWFSRKQSCVALSTTKEEYVAACSTSCEAVWLWKLLSDLFDLQLDVTCIFCNNKSCVKLSKNLVFHDKSKHIKIKFHYIKDMV